MIRIRWYTWMFQRISERGVAVTVVLLLATAFYAASFFERPPRTNQRWMLFDGITYSRQVRSNPRPVVIHIVEIDLRRPGTRLFVTPGDKSCDLDLPARTTSRFADEFGVQVAINGCFFTPFHAKHPWDYYPHSGDPVNASGLAISDGNVYSNDAPELPVFCVTSDGKPEIRKSVESGNAAQAIAGGHILVEDGASVFHRDTHRYIPRTAVAIDKSGQTLWLIVVDGRQPGYSDGMMRREVADLAIELGADAALNLDGGGSSTLVASEDGDIRVLNAPYNTNDPHARKTGCESSWSLRTASHRGSSCTVQDRASAEA